MCTFSHANGAHASHPLRTKTSWSIYPSQKTHTAAVAPRRCAHRMHASGGPKSLAQSLALSRERGNPSSRTCLPGWSVRYFSSSACASSHRSPKERVVASSYIGLGSSCITAITIVGHVMYAHKRIPHHGTAKVVEVHS